MTAFDMQDMDGQWGWLKIRKDYFKLASAQFCFQLITVKRRLGPALENSVSNGSRDIAARTRSSTEPPQD